MRCVVVVLLVSGSAVRACVHARHKDDNSCECLPADDECFSSGGCVKDDTCKARACVHARHKDDNSCECLPADDECFSSGGCVKDDTCGADNLPDAAATFVLSVAPASVFKVESCSTVNGLSDAKRAQLKTESIDRCVNAFGLLIASSDGCNCDNNLLQVANYAAQFMDTDNDGKADLASQVSASVDSFDGKDTPKLMILCGKDSDHEEFSNEISGDILGYGFSCQVCLWSLRGYMRVELQNLL